MKVNQYLKEFCEVFKVNEHDLKSDSRKPELVADRRLFFHIGRKLGITTTELGAAVNRDHSLVISHTKKITRPEQLLVDANLEHFREVVITTFHVNVETDGFNNEIVILTIDGLRFTTKGNLDAVRKLAHKLKTVSYE